MKSNFFTKLLYAFNLDFSQAGVVWFLLAHGADNHWIASSSREMSDAIGSTVSFRTIHRALETLVKDGILERKQHPNWNTKYRINVPALEAALAQPLPNSPFLPGLGSAPIPFLTRQSNTSVESDTMEKTSS